VLYGPGGVRECVRDGGLVDGRPRRRSVTSRDMGSHAERHRDDVTPAACPAQCPCVDDTGDLLEGWGGVELALAYVDQMVGRLADVADDGPVVVDGGGVTDRGKVCPCHDEPASHRPRSRDVVRDEDEDVTSAVNQDTCSCINDACHLL